MVFSAIIQGNLEAILLRLRVTQNALELPMFFFPSSIPCFSNRLAKLFCQCFIIDYPGSLWPGLDLLVWHIICFKDKHWQRPKALSHLTLWSRGLSRAWDKLKTFMQDHSAYDHQTLQDDDLLWVAPTHNVPYSVGHMVLKDHLTN